MLLVRSITPNKEVRHMTSTRFNSTILRITGTTTTALSANMMRRAALIPLYLVLLMFWPLGYALAEPPDAKSIVEAMKKAMEPERPSLRTIKMVMRAPDSPSVEWTTRQARKHLPEGNAFLTVRLRPKDVKGVALLVVERRNQKGDAQWIYLPTVRRVREVLPVSAYEAFLGTDFTYADLGLFNLRDRTFTLLGEETVGNTSAYKVEEVPIDQRYYSRIVTWIAKDTTLPLRRDFYDPANHLWRSERIEDSAIIDGVPTLLRVRMDDNEAHTSTEMRTTNVRYDVNLPDGLFEVSNLPKAAANPVWSR
jgi:outer membrane lipoprotein-sorting protein